MIRLRPAQERVLRYSSGRMGVAAVPGSGKTTTLAMLAARLVAEAIQDDEEVLVVTLVNSAVNNVSARIDQILKERKLIPRLGYRVRTLHGLAHDIVRERPGLVGLSEDFQILDERECARILEDCCQAWLKLHPEILDSYVLPDIEEKKREWIGRDPWPETVQSVAAAFVRRAKDHQIPPEVLLSSLADRGRDLPLAAMGTGIYASYQRALAYRGGVDFDDLIRLALDALRLDPDYLARLRARWPFILEDEAQDSSALQEKILSTLAGEKGNWVRVGDTNQAIFETFTTASPDYLRAFVGSEGVTSCDLPNSGRSCQGIIDLANYLVEWAMRDHPEAERARKAFSPQYIEPSPPGDSQPNPDTTPGCVQIVRQGFSADEEIQKLVLGLQAQPAAPDETVAVLAPRNARGFKVSDALRANKIDCVELLQSTSATRQTAGVLGTVLRCLADAASPTKLADAFRAWRRDDRSDPEDGNRLRRLEKLLRGCRQVEDYLWPRLSRDWLASVDLGSDPEASEHLRLLTEFRTLLQTWQDAILLPIDQLVLTVAQDLFREPAELALAYKLSLLLRSAADVNPGWGLPELTEELAVIARNQRKFIGLSEDDVAFDPAKYKGKVVVTTMHKAKGLEWDRVYLMSVNNYDFPSAQSYDSYISEKWFIRDGLNLEAEALAQLDVVTGAVRGTPYREGEATHRARLDYVAERLRLLYVAVTRARRRLIITWNTGQPSRPARQAVPLIALQAYLEGRAGAELPHDLGKARKE
jgi:DNA helicase II / ATP-dependent DNA helicase PcrA